MKTWRVPAFFLLGLLLPVACKSTVGGGGSGGGGGAGGSGNTSSGAGGLPDYGACVSDGECVLVSKTCCGGCGPVELANLEPVNRQWVDAHHDEICPDPQPGCPECAGLPNPHIFAQCSDQGRCVGADLRTHKFGTCIEPADCTLRYGSRCCPTTCGGTNEDVTALATSQVSELETAVCLPAGEACDACLPGYPAGMAADCIGGQCLAIDLAGP